LLPTNICNLHVPIFSHHHIQLFDLHSCHDLWLWSKDVVVMMTLLICQLRGIRKEAGMPVLRCYLTLRLAILSKVFMVFLSHSRQTQGHSLPIHYSLITLLSGTTQFGLLKRLLNKSLHGFSPQANYTDRATAACRRN
jgi:hypothetical protein